jgi:hypothetical protein
MQNYLYFEHVKSRNIKAFATCTVLNLQVLLQSVLSADVPITWRHTQLKFLVNMNRSKTSCGPSSWKKFLQEGRMFSKHPAPSGGPKMFALLPYWF